MDKCPDTHTDPSDAVLAPIPIKGCKPGTLTARQRIDALLDPESFVEIGELARSSHPDLKHRTPADGVVCGHGMIDGRMVYIASDDGTVLGGTRGLVGERKINRVRELALKNGKPFIAFMEAGAARVQERYGAMSADMGSRFGSHFLMSGRVPQVASIMGPAFGGPSFNAAQSDFTTLSKVNGRYGMSGPLIVKVGIGTSITSEELGGAEICGAGTGQVDHIGESDHDCITGIRQFLSFFPDNCDELPPVREPRQAPLDTEEGKEKLRKLLPTRSREAYDMKRILVLITDAGEFFEYRRFYGRNLITGWGRVEGQPVGFVASNPMVRGGALDEKTTQKARKFIDLCDAFHIPLVFICDAPGFLVGPEVEKHRMVSLASRLLNTLFATTVPRITIVARKAIGLAYVALGGRVTNPDAIVAWPTAHFDVMGPEAGIQLVYGKEIATSKDPAARQREIEEKIRVESSTFAAAEMGLIDDVIDPGETRDVIIRTLKCSESRRKPGFKHRIDP